MLALGRFEALNLEFSGVYSYLLLSLGADLDLYMDSEALCIAV